MQQCKSHIQVFFYDAMGTFFISAIRQLSRCYSHYLVCSKYLDALTILWKICLLFNQGTADCISHKSPRKYHTLQKLDFGSAGKFFSLLSVKHMKPWICCVLHSNDEMHIVRNALTNLTFVFVSYLKQGACGSLLHSIVVGPFQVIIAFVFKFFSFFVRVSRWGNDVELAGGGMM